MMDHDHAFDYEHSPSSYHKKSGTFYDDSDSMIHVVDDVPSDLKMAADTMRRPDSCADPSAIFMSHHTRWDDHMQQESDMHHHHPAMEHHGPYTRPIAMRSGSCTDHHLHWSCENPPMPSRSNSMFECFPHEYHPEGPQVMSPSRESFGPAYAVPPCGHGRSHPVLTPPPDGSAPLSPQSNDWMSSAAREVEAQPSTQKRMRLNPSQRSNSPIQRPDGIRKKNAKFEIPEERNLQTLDGLIKNATDEHSVKELKMQKRLLRNREAALHSRQKKKEHTMRLEGEQKQLHNQISALEDQVRFLKMQAEEHERERKEWSYRQREAEDKMRQLEIEKETLVKSFTKETGELQNQISMLQTPSTTQSSPISTVPSTATFSEYHSDIQTVALDGNDWNEFDLVNDFCINLDPSVTSHHIPTYGGDPIKKDPTSISGDKSAASELLLMLVLLGAYVAANPSSAPIEMPKDIGLASSTVLDNFFGDAGVAPLGDWQATPRRKSSTRRTEKPSVVSYKQCTDLSAVLNGLRSDNQVHSIASLYTGSILTRNARADIINNFKNIVTASRSDEAIKADPDPL